MVRSIGAFLVVGAFVGGFGACSPKSGDDGSGPSGLMTAGGGNAGMGGFTGASGFGGIPNGGSANSPSGGDGGGPVFIQTGGAQGNSGAAGRDGGCGGYSRTGEIVPLDIYIMYDRSASMTCSAGATNRWDAVKAAMTSFVQNAGATTINVGLGYFGLDKSPPGSLCDPKLYMPDVEIGPLAQTAGLIVNSLNAHAPDTDTPTYPALQSAISHAIGWKDQHPGHTVVVVLVTDGQPNACGANNVDQIVATADTGFANGGIPTYVIGIIGTLDASGKSTCALDPNAPTVGDLDRVATAGGTSKALIVDTANTQQDPGAQFLATMNNIRQNAQIPCEYSIPPDKNTHEPPDPEKVNVGFSDPQQKATDLFFVDTKDKCDPAAGGWYFDKPQEVATPEKPTKIILCPQTCSTVTGTFGYAVNIQLDCPRRPDPH